VNIRCGTSDRDNLLAADPGKNKDPTVNRKTVLGTLDDGRDSWYHAKDERNNLHHEIISDITPLQ
jgi:hypothetical protein